MARAFSHRFKRRPTIVARQATTIHRTSASLLYLQDRQVDLVQLRAHKWEPSGDPTARPCSTVMFLGGGVLRSLRQAIGNATIIVIREGEECTSTVSCK